MREILILIGVTFLPALELRASIPLGILQYKMNPFEVFLICIAANICLGILFFLMLETVVKLMRKWEWFDIWYNRILLNKQKKIQYAVDKWGEIGVAIFIGIPLPGSGVITGAIGSYAIGLSRRKFFVANVIGVLIAGVVVTLVTITGEGIIRKLFIRT